MGSQAMLSQHGDFFMGKRVEDELTCIQAILLDDFHRNCSVHDSISMRVRLSEGVWIYFEVFRGYPERARLKASYDREWSFRCFHLRRKLDKKLSRYVGTLPLGTEMVMPVVDYARDLVQKLAPLLAYHGDGNEELRVDRTIPSPGDNPPVPSGCLPLLTIGMKVVVVESQPHHVHFRGRIGILARYEHKRQHWWVKFPRSTMNCHWAGAWFRSDNLFPFKSENAFKLYKQLQHKCHVSGDLVKCGDATEEEQLRSAVLASEESLRDGASFRDKEKCMQATHEFAKTTQMNDNQLMQAISESANVVEDFLEEEYQFVQIANEAVELGIMRERSFKEKLLQIVNGFVCDHELQVINEPAEKTEVSLWEEEEGEEKSMQAINEFAKLTEVQQEYHVIYELDDLNMEEWLLVNH